jgi:hypothetical protein
MPMNFELTISGMCVIALKSDSDEERPAHPDEVDVLCVGACEHRPRLSYLPHEVNPQAVEPDLVIDPWGVRSASVDLTQQALKLDFKNNPETYFSLTWGEEGTATPLDESAMNWVPTADDLGFKKLELGQAGQIPGGVNARLSLPYGKLFCRNVVRDPVSSAYLVWDFPAKGIKRALANEVVYRAQGVTDLTLTSHDGTELLSADKSEGTLYMSISNDLGKVPKDYRGGIEALDHLSHLQSMAPDGVAFDPPKVDSPKRTGHPICNQVLYMYKG